MLSSIVVLVLFGILLVLLETFLPGGILGTLGILSILAAIILTLSADELGWSSGQRAGAAIGIVFFSGVAIFVWLKFFAVTLFRKTFTLSAESDGHAGKSESNPQPGTEGVALTELRPLGRAEIGGRRFDVRCQTGIAPQGASLKVIGHEPGNLIVKVL